MGDIVTEMADAWDKHRASIDADDITDGDDVWDAIQGAFNAGYVAGMSRQSTATSPPPRIPPMPERTKGKRGALSERERELALMLLEMPDLPEGMTVDNYTDYCTGADGTRKQPYPKRHNRQCSIGYHYECTDPNGERCGCPCHRLRKMGIDADALLAELAKTKA